MQATHALRVENLQAHQRPVAAPPRLERRAKRPPPQLAKHFVVLLEATPAATRAECNRGPTQHGRVSCLPGASEAACACAQPARGANERMCAACSWGMHLARLTWRAPHLLLRLLLQPRL